MKRTSSAARKPGARAPTPLGEPLLSADEVAAYLQVDRATVYRLAGRPDGLPVIELSGRVRRFRPEDVRSFIEARTRRPKAVQGRAARLLRTPLPGPRNDLAMSPRQSVHGQKQESSRGSASRTKER